MHRSICLATNNNKAVLWHGYHKMLLQTLMCNILHNNFINRYHQ